MLLSFCGDFQSLPLRECGLKFLSNAHLYLFQIVTPLAGVWIEISVRSCCPRSFLVTPLAGVWIEICRDNKCRFLCCVTPLAGVWIEITDTSAGSWQNIVTPLAGVWIEISCTMKRTQHTMASLPLRECGLKFEEMINCFKIMGRLWRCYLKGF